MLVLFNISNFHHFSQASSLKPPNTEDVNELVIHLPEEVDEDQPIIIEEIEEVKQEDVVVLHPSISTQQFCKR